jgi:hypothetical protein
LVALPHAACPFTEARALDERSLKMIAAQPIFVNESRSPHFERLDTATLEGRPLLWPIGSVNIMDESNDR